MVHLVSHSQSHMQQAAQTTKYKVWVTKYCGVRLSVVGEVRVVESPAARRRWGCLTLPVAAAQQKLLRNEGAASGMALPMSWRESGMAAGHL